MSEELKPCPFCGQQDAFVEQLDSDASVVICQGRIDEYSACLARGPVGVQQSDMEDQPGRGAAVAEWNRRAQPAEAEGVERWSKLKELAEKATPGPWVSFCRPSVQAVFGPNGVQANSEGTIVNWPGFDSSDTTKAKRKANAKFIAAANPAAVLELIAALSAVTAERDRLREAFGECIQSLHDEMLQSYGGQKPDDMHPVTRRNYDRDMAEIAEYRAAMAAKEA